MAAVLAGLLTGWVVAVRTTSLEFVGVVLVAAGILLLSGVPPSSGCIRLLFPSLSAIFSRELPRILRVGQSSVVVVSVQAAGRFPFAARCEQRCFLEVGRCLIEFSWLGWFLMDERTWMRRLSLFSVGGFGGMSNGFFHGIGSPFFFWGFVGRHGGGLGSFRGNWGGGLGVFFTFVL